MRIFDGHNDVLSRLGRYPGLNVDSFFSGWPGRHMDHPRLRASGVSVAVFAIFVPSPETDPAAIERLPDGYRVPLAAPLDEEAAREATERMMDYMDALIERSSGTLFPVLRPDDLDPRPGCTGCILHLEGADGLGADLSRLERWYERGLRMLGPVWSRPNRFAHGVPFAFPCSPDTGPGLTADGRQLVRDCARLRILLDVSHLNERGFWDLLGETGAPVVASHSGAHALCRSTRNLTDAQIDALAKTDGLVGITFSTSELHPHSRLDRSTPLATLIDHIEHVAARVGSVHVALGSDFEGAVIPDDIGDVTGMGKIAAALFERGWNDADVGNVMWRSWERVFRAVL